MLQTKLCIPKINKAVVIREKIAEKLKLLPDYQLAVVSAPAGYGKTTAVANFLLTENIKHAWFSIDDVDNDPVSFWRYLTASISFCLKTDSFAEISINAELIQSYITVDLIIEALSGIHENIVIVMDDYHLIHNTVILKSVERFVKYMPPNCSVIILSRKEPEYGFLKMCSKETAIKLDIRDLSFGFDETAELLISNDLHLSTEKINILNRNTEGWAAGLIASIISMKESNNISGALITFSGKNKNIDGILNNEVFNLWSDEVKAFLVHTSFLDKLSGELCGKVTGNDKSTELLKELASHNSFIIPLDNENHWFRYHHLFQEFLLGRLETEQDSIKCSLYDNAGDWYKENAFIPDAINCYIKAKKYEKAFPLIWDIYLSVVQKSEYSTWRKWMESMPEELCESDVRACTGYSWVLSMEGRLDDAQIWADKAQACFDRIKDSLSEQEIDFLQANISITYANIAIYNMDAERAMNYYKIAYQCTMYMPIVIGEMNAGEPNLLNTAYGFKGRLSKITASYGNLIDDLPKLLGDFSTYISVTLASCYYEQGNLKAVYETLVNHMGRITSLNTPGIIVPCFIILAKVMKAKGDISGAFKVIESGEKILAEKTKSVWSYFLNISKAELSLSIGDVKSLSKYMDLNRIGIYDRLSASRELEYIIYSRYLILTNQLNDSIILLKRLDNFAQTENRLRSQIEILCLTAISYNKLGDSKNAMLTISKALELGESEGYIRIFIDELEPMIELLTKHLSWMKQLDEGRNPQFVKSLLKLTKENIRTLRNNTQSDNITTGYGQLATVPLSARELDVLKLLVLEYSNQEIAEKLFITIRTVKFHTARIYEKLGVKNRLEAIIKARELGFAS